MMRVVLITQDDPFVLPKHLDYLIKSFPKHSKIVACVLLEASPYAKRGSFLSKIIHIWKIFGTKFLLHYGLKYIKSRFNKAERVKFVLEKYDIPIIKLKHSINHSESIAQIKKYKPDLLISILSNQIFKEPILTLAPKGCINLHSALLPKYRGLMPTFWVLKNNEKITGVSVFFMDKGIDNGPIIVQKKFEVGNRTLEELIDYAKKIGMDAIIEAVDLIYKDEYNLIENRDEESTYYSFPTRRDVKEFLRKGKRFF